MSYLGGQHPSPVDDAGDVRQLCFMLPAQKGWAYVPFDWLHTDYFHVDIHITTIAAATELYCGYSTL